MHTLELSVMYRFLVHRVVVSGCSCVGRNPNGKFVGTKMANAATVAVVVSVSLLAVFILVLLVYRCVRSSRAERRYVEDSGLLHEMGDSTPAPPRYTVQRKLGDGTYGTVYLAKRNEDGLMVAVKVVPCSTEKQANEAFNEYTMCQLLQGHPNVVRLLDLFQDRPVTGSKAVTMYGAKGISNTVLHDLRVAVPKGSSTFVCIVTEYYSRGTLFDLLVRHRRGLPEKVVWDYTRQLFSSLQFMHAHQLIHRDMKPSNVLVSDDERRLALTDFGLSKEIVAGEYVKTKIGTYHYMAPEQMERQKYNAKADVWAVGCLIYAMCTAKVSTREAVVMFVARKSPDFESRYRSELTLAGYSEPLIDLMLSVLEETAASRPSAEAALKRLEQIQAAKS
jgi:serine/threonine protein kinase